MASSCYYLTVAEKNAFLVANPTYALVSGPHNTEADCLTICDEGVTGTGTNVVVTPPITQDCCPGTELPLNITFTFVIAGMSLPAQWDAAESRYECDLTLLGCPDTWLYLVCQEQVWFITGAANVQGGVVSCDPLELTFSVPEICGIVNETITVTE